MENLPPRPQVSRSRDVPNLLASGREKKLQPKAKDSQKIARPKADIRPLMQYLRELIAYPKS